MSKVINDAVCDEDFPSDISEVQSLTDNDDADAESENRATWPEIPCFLVKREFIKLIVEYCEHFDYYRELDIIPMPIGKPGVDERHKWLEDQWSAEWIGKMKLHQLTQLLLAANYLNVPALIELCCATLASIYKCQEFNKIKKEIDQVGLEGIKYTHEEDQELMEKYSWVLEDINDDDALDLPEKPNKR